MAEITIAETVELPLGQEEAFDFLLSPKAYELFTGWGPIPGVLRLDWERGSSAEEGSVGRVHNSDGSTHRERVLEVAQPRRYVVAIDEFSSVFRFLTAGATESWDLTPTDVGTRVDRSFVFRLRSRALLPFGRLVGAIFRRAVRRNHEAMVAWARERSARDG